MIKLLIDMKKLEYINKKVLMPEIKNIKLGRIIKTNKLKLF